MDKAAKDKVIGYALLTILAMLYIGSLSTSDVPSYEIDGLKGYRWLLFWSHVLYLPIFPLVSGIFGLGFGKKAIAAINMAITLSFTLFAWVLDWEFISWTLLLAASVVIVSVIIYDERNDTKRRNKDYGTERVYKDGNCRHH